MQPQAWLTAVLVAALAVSATVRAQSDDVVSTHLGPVRGKILENSRLFRGIRYGRGPVGDLRWTSPVDPEPWTEVADATENGNICPGTSLQQLFNFMPNYAVSEDCLFLNVYTPSADRLTRPLPVMVWFYGGAFVLGDNWELGFYDGTFTVSGHDVIIVAPNYRLGPFGFLVTESLRGNYGLEDQRFALEWVQRNIAQFGGDPNNVLIYGESAGAMSVGAQLSSPPARGLFHRAIMQSNAFGIRFKPRDFAIELGNGFAEAVGCGHDDVVCLRNATLETIAFKHGRIQPRSEYWLADLLTWGPTVDGEVLPMASLDAFLEQSEYLSDVPLLWGVNKDEAVLFTDVILIAIDVVNAILGTDFDITFPPPVYNVLLDRIFGDKSDLVREAYPPVSENNYQLFSSLVTDFMFRCPSLHAAESYAQATSNPVYAYHFTHTPDYRPQAGNITQCYGTMACHAMELPYTFHIPDGLFTPEEELLSAGMIDYWTNFAAGNINGHGPEVVWPRFNATTLQHVLIHDTFSVATWDIPGCDVFAEIGYLY